MVERLIAHKADPDVVDATGKSAISYAAARGFAGVVRRLLDAGVDARRAYGNNLTALMWAAGHEDGVRTRDAVSYVDVGDRRVGALLVIKIGHVDGHPDARAGRQGMPGPGSLMGRTWVW